MGRKDYLHTAEDRRTRIEWCMLNGTWDGGFFLSGNGLWMYFENPGDALLATIRWSNSKNTS